MQCGDKSKINHLLQFVTALISLLQALLIRYESLIQLVINRLLLRNIKLSILEINNMTKVKKMVLGTVFTVVTLGGIAAYATADGCGKFGGMQNKGSEFMLNRVSSRLSLNAEQQQKLESLQKTVMAEMQIQQEKHPRNQIIELISEPKLNQEKALAIMAERSKKMEESAPKIITAIADFTDSLNEEQRADLKQMIDRFGMHRGPGRGAYFKGPFF